MDVSDIFLFHMDLLGGMVCSQHSLISVGIHITQHIAGPSARKEFNNARINNTVCILVLEPYSINKMRSKLYWEFSRKFSDKCFLKVHSTLKSLQNKEDAVTTAFLT